MIREPHVTRFESVTGNSFVLPQHKVVYISTTKVACTSLKWMVSDLGGEDLEVFRQGASRVQSPLMKIHRGRGRFRHVKNLVDLTPDELREIRPDNGWFIFGLLRDPWSRLWSAWQSKFLVRHHRYLTNFGDRDFFPRIPTQASFVVEDFRTFVEMHPWTSDPILKNDNHFQTQIRWLKPDRIPYSRIYDLRDFADFKSDLHQHLSGLGLDQDLYLPRANETPLAMTREVMGGGVRERVVELYRDDFSIYGDRWDFEKLSFAPDGWNKDALSHAAFQTEANGWLDQVYSKGEQWRDERDDLATQLRKARRRIKRLERRSKAAPLKPSVLRRVRKVLNVARPAAHS